MKNKLFKSLILLLISIISSSAYSQNMPDTYSEYSYGKLDYGFYTPVDTKDGEKYPLIMFLHGMGQNKEVYFLEWYEDEVQEKNPCFVFTPKTPISWADWSGWGSRLSEPMGVAIHVLDSLIEKYPIDTCRIYVYGTSMGGEGTFDLLDKYPNKFAAAMSVCGGGKPEWAENISRTPLWMFHGSADEVNPVTLTRDVYDEMVKIGATKMIYTEYEGWGHNIWIKAPQEAEWLTWMFKHRKCK